MLSVCLCAQPPTWQKRGPHGCCRINKGGALRTCDLRLRKPSGPKSTRVQRAPKDRPGEGGQGRAGLCTLRGVEQGLPGRRTGKLRALSASVEEDRGRRERGEEPQGGGGAKVLRFFTPVGRATSPSLESLQDLTVSASSAARDSGATSWFSLGQTSQLGMNGANFLSVGKPGPQLSAWDPTAPPRPVLSTLSPIDPRKIARPRLRDATWASHHQRIQQTPEGGLWEPPAHPCPPGYSEDPTWSLRASLCRCSGRHEARPCSQELTVLRIEPSALNHTTVLTLGPVGQSLEGRDSVFPEKWGRERKGTSRYAPGCGETPGSWRQDARSPGQRVAPLLSPGLQRSPPLGSTYSLPPADTRVPAPSHTELSDCLSSVRGSSGQSTEGQPPGPKSSLRLPSPRVRCPPSSNQRPPPACGFARPGVGGRAGRWAVRAWGLWPAGPALIVIF